MNSLIIFKYKVLKNLSFGSTRINGRNNSGKITRYHRGGGCKKKTRNIDYYRYISNLFGFVNRIEYDPKRNALISLVSYSNGIITYILNCEGLGIGDFVYFSSFFVNRPGFSTYLANIGVGVKINSIQSSCFNQSQFIRSAGCFATIISKLSGFVLVKLKSNEIRKFNSLGVATVGAVSNFNYIFRNFQKAGYYRLMGWRPVVRGVAMNPIDHPHGGGQGKTSGGRPSVTPYGVITKGKPTVKKKSIFVVKKRKN